MTRPQRWRRWVTVVAVLAASTATPPALCGQTVVRAVLFFSPTCPHCHQVINEDLPVIFERFGTQPRVWVDQSIPQNERAFYLVANDQLEILLIDVSRPVGAELYEQASQRFLVPRERMGVPRLVVGNTLLVGSVEIPSQFPDIVTTALASEGLDWPALDGLRERIPAVPRTEATGDAPQQPGGDRQHEGAGITPPDEPQATHPDTAGQASAVTEANMDAVPQTRDGSWNRFTQDPVGNTLAVIVLAGMLISIYVVFARGPGWQARASASALLPVLAIVGLGVAGYLSYVEASSGVAVCGPVGDCNAVQQSPYARLFGVPVGVLGLAGYSLMTFAWVLGRGAGRLAAWSTAALFGMVFAAVLFSSYLTFLEPFVIGATCLWCLSSAVVLTAMLWLSAGPGFRALGRLRRNARTAGTAPE